MGKISGGSIPRPPSASQQTASNIDTALATQLLNFVNQSGPFGSVTYRPTGQVTRIGGQNIPQYEQVTSLSPQQQAQYNQLQQIQGQALGLGQGAIQRAGQSINQPFNYENLPGQVTNVQAGPLQSQVNFAGAPALPGVSDFSQDRGRVEQSLYERETRRLDPQFQQQRAALEQQLANQGVARGSRAFQNAVSDFERQQNDAYAQARQQSILGGGQEQSRLFGLGLTGRQQAVQEALSAAGFGNQAQQQAFQQAQANAALQNQGRQQGIQERAYQRSLPLNELSQLLGFGGQIQQPQFSNVPQSGVSGTNIYDAYNANLARANQRQQGQAQLIGGLFGLGGAALGGLPFF